MKLYISTNGSILNLNKSQLNSLDYVANRFMMKLFNTNNMQYVMNKAYHIPWCGTFPSGYSWTFPFYFVHRSGIVTSPVYSENTLIGYNTYKAP